MPIRVTAALHPLMHAKVAKLEGLIAEAGLPFRIYETLRGRARQERGKASGRSGAGMWRSYHNFGLALDFVGWVDSKWSWDNGLPWSDLGALALEAGLTWGIKVHGWVDRPHVQWPVDVRSGLVADPVLLLGRLDEWHAWTAQWVRLFELVHASDKRIFAQMFQATMNHLGQHLVVDGVFGPLSRASLMSLVGWKHMIPEAWAPLSGLVLERG